MRLLHRLFLSLLSIAWSVALHGQSVQQSALESADTSWQGKMLNSEVNFYEARDAFERYWAGKEYERSKGYKQFKRWEWFMEQRCFPTGVRPRPDAVMRAMQEAPEMFSSNAMMNGAWQYIGNTSIPANGGGAGRVNSVRNQPGSSSIFYACAPGGGLWKTTNGGTSWSLMNTDYLAAIGISDVAIDPNNPNILYIATGDGNAADTYSIGVWKSTDGGTTWFATGLNWQVTQTRTTTRLLIHPTNGNILHCATSNGIWRTTDGGTNWTQSQAGDFKEIKYKPGDTNTIYACGSTFWRSTNAGVNWTQVTSGLPSVGVSRLAIAVSANNPNYVYVLAGNNSNYGLTGVYRSADSGVSFTQRHTASPNLLGWDASGSDAGGQAWYDLQIECDPANAEVVFTGGVNVWRSVNGGTNFSCVGHWYGQNGLPYVHADIHSLFWLPGTTTLMVGCDGGVFTTNNSGASFSDLSSNLQISQQYRLGLSASNSNLILTGWQDNGTNLKNNLAWSQVIGGDGMECAIHPTNPSIMYGELYYGAIRRSTNGGLSFSQIVSSGGTAGTVNESGAWVTPYVLGTNPAHMFVGKSRVYRSLDGGTSWTALGAIGSGNVNSLAVAPSNNNVIYASKSSTLYRSTDGMNFTTLTGLPALFISYITVHPTDPNRLWVTLSGFTSGQKVYTSTDGGTSWTNFSGNLPNLPANCIVYQNGSNDGIYVGMEAGVYYRDNTLTNWIPYNNGFPNVEVDELEIHYGTNRLVAATYGRGLWSAPLYTLPTRDISVSITAPSGSACNAIVSPQLLLTNAGLNTITSLSIDYQVVGQALQNFSWTGNLVTGASTNVSLPSYNFGTGTFTLNVTITQVNGVSGDDNSSNNSASTTYTVINAAANDACAAAIPLTIGAAATSANNTNTCSDGPNPNCGGTSIIKDVWYSFVYTGGTVTITTALGGLTDTRLAVYTACGGTQIACNDDIASNNYASRLILSCPQLTAGQTYLIQTGGYNNAAGTFSISISSAPIVGCTNPAASNYNACANQDNGTCTIPGCTDPLACNYNPLATQNNGSCIAPTTYYRDLDGDGFGNPSNTTSACSLPSGFVTNNSDCNDNNSAVYPGATEVCNTIDDNCNTLIDDGLATQTWYMDNDGDGFGAGAGVVNCQAPSGSVSNNLDCNDTDALIFPGASEVCNTLDDDCDSFTDEGLLTTFYRDADGDGFGNPAITTTACTEPVGFVANDADCNDSNGAIHPAAAEVCDTVDNDCDASIDEGVLLTFYADADGDGFGGNATTIEACSAPPGFSQFNNDCNDGNASVHPGAAEVCDGVDNNCNISIDENFDLDNDGFTSCNGDCNDTNPNIFPGASEQCNGTDDNCNTLVDDGVVVQNWYIDADNDGFGAGAPLSSCSAPPGRVSNNDDCDDLNAARNPNETELCDGLDNDCDLTIDEGFDADGDGFTPCAGDCDDGNALRYPGAAETCNNIDDDCDTAVDEGFDTDGDGFTTCGGDCDDNNAQISPVAPETCNGLDDDCDTEIDEGIATGNWYADNDGDGFGAGSPLSSCVPVPGRVSNNLDCNDASNTIFPGSSEVCNTLDDDCDGAADEGVLNTYYADADGDGYGNPSTAVLACSPPAGHVANFGDCNDNNALYFPGATEVCNSADDNCNGTVDEGCGVTPPNDIRLAAQPLIVPAYPSCVSTPGTLVGCSPSSEADAVSYNGAGEDIWYRFMLPSPTTGIVRIVVAGIQNNIAVLLQRDVPTAPFYEDLEVENVLSAVGGEMMTASGLVPGVQYRICVRKTDATQPTNFTICVSHVRPNGCGFSVTNDVTRSLCDVFLGTYTGAQQYVMHFTNASNPSDVIVKTLSGNGTSPASTLVPLANTPGMQYGQSYHVRTDGYYSFTNALGQSETMIVNGTNVCMLHTTQQPLLSLATMDQCANSTRVMSSVVSTQWICGNSEYEWELTPTIGLPMQYTTETNFPSRFMRVGNLNGIYSGGTTFNVRIRPWFRMANGESTPGIWGPSASLCIAGPTVVDVQEENDGSAESIRLSALHVAPNPIENNLLMFMIASPSASKDKLEVYDAFGRLVYRSTVSLLEGNNQVVVPMESELTQGLYLLTITRQSGEVVNGKFILR